MQTLDWLIIVLYFLLIVVVGTRKSRKSYGIEGYFLADREMPWYVIGLSVMATQLSAITLIGTTGQGYADGMRFLQLYFGLPLAMVIICVTAVPLFHRARVLTAYEYLENRFDAKTRSLTGFLFLLSRAAADGVVLYAPAVVLSILLGWNETVTILVMGVFAIVYTVSGGMRAIMWLEVWQMMLIFIGILAALVMVVLRLPPEVSLWDAMFLAGSTGHMRTIDLNPDPRVSYTLWSGLIGGLFLMLAYFGCDQSQVQRYLTGSSVTQSRQGLLFNAFLKIPMQWIVLFTGCMVFIFFQFEKPPIIFNGVELVRLQASDLAPKYRIIQGNYDLAFEERRRAVLQLVGTRQKGEAVAGPQQRFLDSDRRLQEARKEATDLVSRMNGGAPFNDTNYIFPSYVFTYLPAGLAGLFVATIFAAAMSTVESELNSLATVTVVDIYKRHLAPDRDERHYVFMSKFATAFWGVFACVVALYVGRLGSAIEVVNRIGSYFYGSILGVFILAMGTRRATGRGAFFGLLTGMASVWLVSSYSSVAFLWYNLIGCTMVVAVGYPLSLTDARRRPRGATP